MKSTFQFVLFSCVLFVCGAYGMWLVSSKIAHDKTTETLCGAPRSFCSIHENSVGGVLWYASRLVLDDLGAAATARSTEFMQELARTHHMDEINIISKDGIIIASNFSKLVGVDVKRDERTRVFMDIISPESKMNCCVYPVRRGVSNPEVVSKYFCMAFPDRSGVLELGVTAQRLMKSLCRVADYDYARWKIGQYGYFRAVDEDMDGVIDVCNSMDVQYVGEPEEVTTHTGERAFVLEFSCSGMLYQAILPMREYYEQRNKVVAWACLVAGIFFITLVIFMVKRAETTARLSAMHERIERQTARDLVAARTIQLSSLQRAETFRVSSLDSTIAAVTFPAREVGGDIYGMFELHSGHVAIAVGDVSGKGVPAAMFMHIAKNTFELRVRSHDDLAEAVARSNDYLCERNQAEMFVTAWFGTLDPATGIVEYVNAGHNRPYVVRANGNVERVEGKGGRFLGMFPNVTYKSQRLRLNRGDRLFVFTDGVTEAMDAQKRLYGEDRLVALLRRAPCDLCMEVKADVDAFAGGAEQSDDLTMLELTYHGKPERVGQCFPADADSLGGMLEFVRGVVRFKYVKQELRLLNAVDELLSNIVNYSSSPAISIFVENIPGRCRVTISDSGEAYNPIQHQDPDTHQSIKDRPIGGLGILMVKRLVNSVKYSRQGGKNVVALVQIDFDGKYRQIV